LHDGVILLGRNLVDLQATLATATWGPCEVGPHHPITCHDELAIDDEFFSCPHASVPVDEPRTVACIHHSIALLLIELAMQIL
jgi:hypothetical protein